MSEDQVTMISMYQAMNQMVEQVARAMFKRRNPDGNPDEALLVGGAPFWTLFVDDARAAIASLRDLPDEYLVAMVRTFNLKADKLHIDAARSWYESMIDEALK